MHPVQLFTQNIQACTCCGDTRLVNSNLKMNTNSPFHSKNNWACIIGEKGEKAEGNGSVIEVLKVLMPSVPEASESEQKEDSKTNTDVSISKMSLCFALQKRSQETDLN